MNPSRNTGNQTSKQLDKWDFPLTIVIGVLLFVIHEFAHWITGELLGYDMYLSINRVGLARGEYSTEWHQQLVSISGPLVTVIVALGGLISIQRLKSPRLFGVVFFSLMMRAMATAVSTFNPNDEARVSEWLGIGKWTLPFAVTFLLGWLVYLANERLRLNWQSWLISFIACSLAITLVVLTEPYWPVLNFYTSD